MGGVNKLDSLAARLASEANPSVIRAYHGSPHDFDRFDASKIDTGEGAQAYGHGLYFAGNEDTADFYRRKLSEDGDEPAKWARDFWEAQSQPDAIGSPEKAYDYLLGYIRSIRNAGPGSAYSPGLRGHYSAAEKYLLSQDPRVIPPPVRQGHAYEVQIAHPEHALLDWDAPISQQPKAVQRAFGDSAIDRPGDGRRVYQDIATRRGEEFDDDMTGLLAGRAAAGELLQEGIPGIRYLDGYHRSSGQGTRNYVMFPGTEDSIRILRKYAVPGAVGTGVASQYEEYP